MLFSTKCTKLTNATMKIIADIFHFQFSFSFLLKYKKIVFDISQSCCFRHFLHCKCKDRQIRKDSVRIFSFFLNYHL